MQNLGIQEVTDGISVREFLTITLVSKPQQVQQTLWVVTKSKKNVIPRQWQTEQLEVSFLYLMVQDDKQPTQNIWAPILANILEMNRWKWIWNELMNE